MPNYIVTLKKGISDEDAQKAKKSVEEQGGKIGHEYKLGFKGFAVSFPNDAVSTLESNPHVEAVEHDGEVKTQ